MANTYTQLHVHIVFTVQGRENLLRAEHQDEIERYMTGIVQKRKCKLLAIKVMTDHVHILVGLNPDVALSSLVRDTKAGSTNMIKSKRFVKCLFRWQEGYGAFSYAHSQLDRVVRYILDQEKHHRRRTFKEEYLEMLDKFQIAYDNRYLFEWFE